jgi:ankyrin repeat protein
VLLVLIEAGADPKIKDAQGQTALDYAKENAKIFQSMAYFELRDVSAR